MRLSDKLHRKTAPLQKKIGTVSWSGHSSTHKQYSYRKIVFRNPPKANSILPLKNVR